MERYQIKFNKLSSNRVISLTISHQDFPVVCTVLYCHRCSLGTKGREIQLSMFSSHCCLKKDVDGEAKLYISHSIMAVILSFYD